MLVLSWQRKSLKWPYGSGPSDPVRTVLIYRIPDRYAGTFERTRQDKTRQDKTLHYYCAIYGRQV